MNCIVIYCRIGFESDAAAEITHQATQQNVAGYVKTKAQSGFVIFQCFEEGHADKIIKNVPFTQMVFARQWFAATLVENMPDEDRVTPLVEATEQFCSEIKLCSELRVETPDTNDGKELLRFCKKLSVPLKHKLIKKNRLIDDKKGSVNTSSNKRPIMHVLLLSSSVAYVGYSYTNNNSEFFMGIPRLKMPGAAPSRSTLKLDEAFIVFVPDSEKEQRIRSSMNAVDLGACPGGWTYQLVRRGMFVQAVDNGPMAESLMETGQVKHFTEDGFKFRSDKKNIDWLVCDMVEKPAKVTKLMIDWAVNGFVTELIFNLKLPMKKRFDSVYENLSLIRTELKKYNIEFKLQAKHLYHDREEITVNLQITKMPKHLKY
ncbi:23S rRNA (cytidine(2498)-2'-O)-methyltransferase RlmM [Pseudoalteromonas denitrificans]|uniref:Ribosomal RNA large subunit methyltransferase M n=1 Tax=Pseudoalteromonas denitrificans DSM 6059 TaxID=1123010 RepID=A0A1I1F018_9GAMM|nr:23S rRNA (cytidine(2498)-2'-O)-methyltransferase RlmM [Pseudoalteromonas denitrificans]SFB92664.1 23S rRNA (cytidine2498-2'-O)-methyltransferase [Pseudoalteromonas denitrificans DSM 6059]